MTTTTPAQDSETLVNRIIAELRADPAAQSMLLKAMLTGEFLGIPVRLDGIEETLKSIQASISAIETRLDRTDERLDRTDERLDRIEEGQQRTEQRLDRIEAGQQRLEVRQQRTEQRLDRLEEGQQRLEEGQQRTEERLDRTEERLDRIETTVNRLDGAVGNLSGSDYESKLSRSIRSIFSQRFELRRPRIILSARHDMSDEFSDKLEDAVEQNLISDSQRQRIDRTDIIIHAQRKSDRAWIWLAIEASISIHRDDIDRARQSAQALTAAFGEPAVPVAIGQRIDPPETQHAQTANVHIAIVS